MAENEIVPESQFDTELEVVEGQYCLMVSFDLGHLDGFDFPVSFHISLEPFKVIYLTSRDRKSVV